MMNFKKGSQITMSKLNLENANSQNLLHLLPLMSLYLSLQFAYECSLLAYQYKADTLNDKIFAFLIGVLYSIIKVIVLKVEGEQIR